MANQISWIHLLMLVVAIKLALLLILSRRLQQAFPEAWDELGQLFSLERFLQPSWWCGTAAAERSAQWELLYFVFSSQHNQLRDLAVKILVWCVRLTWLLIVVFVVLAAGNVPLEWHLPWLQVTSDK